LISPPRFPGTGCVEGQCTYAVGTMQQASCIELAGTVDLLGVRFRPGAASAFFVCRCTS
jgi:hypothetical protein